MTISEDAGPGPAVAVSAMQAMREWLGAYQLTTT